MGEEEIGDFLASISLKEGADKFEARKYQVNIARSILKKGNSLVIMPTALGKTFIVVLVVAKLVREMRDGKRPWKKFLFLAPTKPLAAQQARRMEELVDFGIGKGAAVGGINGKEGIATGRGMEKHGKEGAASGEGADEKYGKEKEATNHRMDEKNREEGAAPDHKMDEKNQPHNSKVVLLTGEMAPEKREEVWKDGGVICYVATPQTVEFDVLAGRLELNEFEVVVFDEAHRAVKEYSYSFVAREASKASALIIGLTASPSSRAEMIDEICANLGAKNIEIRDESDPDVRKYAHEIKMDWVFVDLPEELKVVRNGLRALLREVLEELKQLGVLGSIDYMTHKRELLSLRKRALEQLGSDPASYKVLSLHARAMNISHAIDLVEIEGVHSLLQFMREMEAREKQSKAVRNLLQDARWLELQLKCVELVERGVEHPKFEKLREVFEGGLGEGNKAIVFAHFRNTVRKIVGELGKIEGLVPVEFIGKSKEGMNQKTQQHVMQQFRDGKYNILVATSVGEEGLDVPDVGLVVFFEAVPSEIRLIQRRGRTGRVREGKVVVLLTKGSKDETLFWSSKRKEKKMREVVEGIRTRGLLSIEEQNEKILGNQARIFDY